LRRPPTQAIPRPEAQQNLAEKRIALDVSGAINAANRGVRRFFVLGVETVPGFRYVVFATELANSRITHSNLNQHRTWNAWPNVIGGVAVPAVRAVRLATEKPHVGRRRHWRFRMAS
jgi:hypothetical protein